MKSDNIYDLIKEYEIVSIIGMDKNVGKTTALNHIIKLNGREKILGLTSIGRDGEEKDRVTGTEKPGIYVQRRTIIATAKECLLNSHITKEILETTGINTPMGEVVISRALSGGFVELGGPSITAYMRDVCDKLKKWGAELVLIDGALSRKTTASPAVSGCTILSTGASLSRSMDKVVEKTAQTVRLLSVKSERSKRINFLFNEAMADSRVGIIFKDGALKKLNVPTSLEAAKEITHELNDKAEYVAVKGIISDRLLEDIIKSTDKYKKVTFLVEDGTKLFLSTDTFSKFEKLGGRIRVINPINLVCITLNPKSPFNYEFDKTLFMEKLKKSIDLPIIDVMNN